MNPATVVTGAASGIGRELARCAALEGAIVVLVDRSQEGLADVTAELGKTGRNPMPCSSILSAKMPASGWTAR